MGRVFAQRFFMVLVGWFHVGASLDFSGGLVKIKITFSYCFVYLLRKPRLLFKDTRAKDRLTSADE